MVEYRRAPLDATFGALADPTRRAILARLASQGEAPVSELARPFRMTLMGVTKHLRVLEEAGLVSTAKRGRVRRCRIELAPLRTAADWINFYQRYWEAQLDSLEHYFKTVAEEEEHRWAKTRKKKRKPSSESDEGSSRPERKSSKRGSTRRS